MASPATQLELQCDVIIPPLPTTERGRGLHIDATIKSSPRVLYCSNNIVVQRDLVQTNVCRLNAEHSTRATVAKFSPNGEWICSGDSSGQVAVWAHKSFVVKNTIAVGKSVSDVAWSHDGLRIVAVGYGKDDKGKVFPWNTNNKLGELTGAQKGFLSCDFKPNRPFRVITSSEDYGVYYYKGPPFKFETYEKNHKAYPNCVRFTPDGKYYISVGADKQILVYDAKTGKQTRQISDGKGKGPSKDHHKGTIYSVSFNSDGSRFITSSADRTCKVWDFVAGTMLHTYTPYAAYRPKPTIMDMQISCLWLNDYVLSISLSGKIHYLDPTATNPLPIKTLTGHRKPINDLDYDVQNNCVYTVDTDKNVIKTECKTNESSDYSGDPHGGPLKYIRSVCDGSGFYTLCSADLLVYTNNNNDNALGTTSIKLSGSARGVVTGNIDPELIIIPTHRNKLIFIKKLAIIKELDLPFTPNNCSLSSDDKLIAIAGADSQIHVYNTDDYTEAYVIKSNFLRAEVLHVSFSPSGEYLASADYSKNIWIWDIANQNYLEPLNKTAGMKYHGGRISSIAWSPNGKRLLTCAYDSTIYLWLKPTEGKNNNIKMQPGQDVITFIGAVTKCVFINENRFVATGSDTTIRFFNVVEKVIKSNKIGKFK